MLELTDLHHHGVFRRCEALDHGYRDRDLVAARRGGLITRIRHGCYTSTAAWDDADDVGRHVLQVHAALLTHGPHVVPSHVSAAALHGLRLWNADLRRVHLTHLAGAGVGRRHGDIVYHEGALTDAECTEREGVLVVAPVRAALETAGAMPVEPGLVVLDSLLDQRSGSVEDLWRGFRQMTRWPHTARLQVTLRLARHGAQSVGESRCRYLCWRSHLPEPTLQWEVRRPDGRLIGLVDLAWPELGVLGEFDGAIKYHRHRRPGESIEEMVLREKRREDDIREVTGMTLVRLVWSDLSLQRRTAERIRAKLRLTAA